MYRDTNSTLMYNSDKFNMLNSILPRRRSFPVLHYALIAGRMIAIGAATIARNGRAVLMA